MWFGVACIVACVFGIFNVLYNPDLSFMGEMDRMTSVIGLLFGIAASGYWVYWFYKREKDEDRRGY